MRRYFLLFCCILAPFLSGAQLPPIGKWREHFSWKETIRVTGDRSAIWCATPSGIFFIDLEENSIHPIGKIVGLSTTGIREIAWDETTRSLVVAYENNMIDLVQAENIRTIYDLRNAQDLRQKTIRHIYTMNGLAYLSTDYGIVVIDLLKKEIKETYIIGNSGQKINVYCLAASSDTLFASTSEGLKKAPRRGVNLSDYRNWKDLAITPGMPSTNIRRVLYWENRLILQQSDSLWSWNGQTKSLLFASSGILNELNVSDSTLLVTVTKNDTGQIVLLKKEGTVTSVIQDPFWTRSPVQVFHNGSGLWIADRKAGLSKFISNSFTGYIPNGPSLNPNGQMIITNEIVRLAPYRPSDSWRSETRKGQPVEFFQDGWNNVTELPEIKWESLEDIHCLAMDEKEQTLWGGSMKGGLFSLRGKTMLTLFERNTPLSKENPIGGMAVDQKGQLWVTNYGANAQLHAKGTNDKWFSFRIPFLINENAAGHIVIDPLDQKWIQLPKSQGLVCFNDSKTPQVSSDDQWRLFRAGKGNGNLPDNEVHCMVIDKTGSLWIGTEKGIGVIPCMENIFQLNACEVLLPVVQQDNFAGYLFRDQVVQSIAVDGANRKWVGTKNGAWLLSAEADSTLLQFNTENSPLPDNDVLQIAIHPVSGEVFFATRAGLVSFRSTATEADGKTTSIQVFPNPVPPGYEGSIAMRGLKENALIKITTADGRLIYETRALGGQAIWDSRDLRGQKPATGIYLVLSAEDPKNIRSVGKIIFIGK